MQLPPVQSCPVDLLHDSVSSIVASLQSTRAEVVLSMLQDARDGRSKALTVGQAKLIQAAAATPTVRLFIPSEFGVSLTTIGRGSVVGDILDAKLEQRELLAAARQQRPEFNYACIEVGSFAEWLVSTPLQGVNLASRTVTALGGLQAYITATSLHDIGAGLEHLISHADYSTLNSNAVKFGSFTLSYADLLRALEQVTGTSFAVHSVAADELRLRLQQQERSNDRSAVLTRFHILFAERGGALDQGVAWSTEESYLHKHQLQRTSLEQVIKRTLQS